MQKYLITDPNKHGVCFVFFEDHMLAKVTPIENVSIHQWLGEAPVGSLVCEHVTGGITYHENMDEVIETVEAKVNKLVSDFTKRKEAVSDYSHDAIQELQFIPC